ncbi:MAG: hypothetical protein P4L85_00445, partial [Paludisphaera borealis]|uniref:hypothetical protein n=1 Tax=Paludisphaera borealis TaxID=1387353 RepID=UPI002851A0E8
AAAGFILGLGGITPTGKPTPFKTNAGAAAANRAAAAAKQAAQKAAAAARQAAQRAARPTPVAVKTPKLATVRRTPPSFAAGR